MMKLFIMLTLAVVLSAFSLKEDMPSVPSTHIGDSSIACHMDSAPKITNGFSTYFSDDTYAC